MATTEILKTTNLQKSFSGIIAAEDINISVKEGEIIGIIGANGAGKTVFVNMITGYLKPTSGTIELLGTKISKKCSDNFISNIRLCKIGFVLFEQSFVLYHFHCFR